MKNFGCVLKKFFVFDDFESPRFSFALSWKLLRLSKKSPKSVTTVFFIFYPVFKLIALFCTVRIPPFLVLKVMPQFVTFFAVTSLPPLSPAFLIKTVGMEIEVNFCLIL